MNTNSHRNFVECIFFLKNNPRHCLVTSVDFSLYLLRLGWMEVCIDKGVETEGVDSLASWLQGEERRLRI